MKNVLVFCIILLSLGMNAQTISGSKGNENARLAKITPVDNKIIECVYKYTVYDSELDESRKYFKILEIGKKFSKYSCYNAYRIDSIIKKDHPDGLTVNEYFKLTKNFKSSLDYIIKDFNRGVLQSYDKVFIDNYVYEESIPAIKWKLVSGKEEICGYSCRKAVCEFRGRKWTAWYCDLSVNNGPWKFGNLPGLILKVEDGNKEHIFEAIIIRKSTGVVAKKERHYQKTTREKFNNALNEYKNNPRSFIGGMPSMFKDSNGETYVPNNRLFYNPIEKD